MSLIKKIFIKSFVIVLLSIGLAQSEDLKKIAKFKDWETIVVSKDNNKVCFAQSKPVLQSPKKGDREARLFVTFRPFDKITDEVSTTSGYEYNNQNSVVAASGKSKFKFDLTQDNFAWISNNKIEKKIVKKMKKASRIMVTGYNKEDVLSDKLIVVQVRDMSREELEKFADRMRIDRNSFLIQVQTLETDLYFCRRNNKIEEIVDA